MTGEGGERCVAFAGDRRIAAGSRADVARLVREALDAGEEELVLVFDEATGRGVELDLRGTPEDVVRRYAPSEGGPSADDGAGSVRKGPGRPRLGVVGREVTLLPRHWAWLSAQRGGASATLRRLVEQARKASAETDRVSRSQDAAYRFMLSAAGDRAGYEEAIRALYARDRAGFEARTEGWPPDVRDQARRMAEGAFDGAPPSAGR
jgi:hypothetical protein